MMKKTLILIVALIFSCHLSNAQEQVRDKGKRRQFQSMVYSHWGKRYFRPKWYYRVFHNRYRKGPDRRYIHQTVPTLGASMANQNRTERENDTLNEVVMDEWEVHFDKVYNTKYNLLYKDIFNELFLALQTFNVDQYFQHLEEFNNAPFAFSDHLVIVDNFKERKKVIDDSYRPSEEKNTEYDQLISDIQNYLGLLHRIRRKMGVYKKYVPYLESEPVDD